MPAFPPNEVLLVVALAGFALYFSLQTLRSLWLVWRCVAMHATALVTWPARGPRARPIWLGLGVLSAASMVVGSLLGAGWLHVFSQGITAFYFLAVPHLLKRMRLGFYVSGVWTDAAFVPYARIARWAFSEAPAILLMLVPRGSRRAVHLLVPGDEYGTALKILQQQTRARVLTPERSLLDLDGAEGHRG